MADLKISALNSLAGADLVAADVVAVVDDSASETKKLTVSDLIANGTTLISDATIPSAKILFSAGAIDTAELAASAVETAKINDSAVTAAKLADNSSVTLVSTLPASGDFTGQIALDTDDDKIYIWDGSAWDSVKGAGSINVVNGSTSGIVNITTSTSGDTVTVSTTLDDTSAAAQFLAGPTGAGGTVGYRAIIGTDLPTATTSAKGGVIVNGNGLVMSGDTLTIDNSVTAETSENHIVQYDANGLITSGRAIAAGDIPVATSSTTGAVKPGSGLGVTAAGEINHSNSITGATAAKVTFDAQGHVTASESLAAADIPDLDASKITTGTVPTARIASDAITAAKLADKSTTTIAELTPAGGDFIGQGHLNSISGDFLIWDGNVWQPIGVSVGEIVLAGTYDASTNLMATVTSEGTSLSYVVGSALPAASASNKGYYVVVSEAGTGTSPAPTVALNPPDFLLSTGTAYTEIDVSSTVVAQVAENISFTAAGNISATNVQAAIEELDTEKVGSASPTFTGTVGIGTGATIQFEGASANDFETTLTVTDPTADRTITLPNVTGTVVTTGDTGSVTSTMILDGTIANADISSSAEIAVSKLANGTARQLLQTDTAGTGVEFTSNVDVPGTLDVTGAATLDSTLGVTGLISADGKVKFPAGSASAPSFYSGTDTNTGLYFSAADEVSITTGGTQRIAVDSSGRVLFGVSSAEDSSIIQSNGVSPASFYRASGSGGPNVSLKRSRGNLPTVYTVVQNNDNLGTVNFLGTDGSAYVAGASIKVDVDGTPGANDMPGRLVFSTTADGAASPSERLRIDSSGNVGIGTSSPAIPLDVHGADTNANGLGDVKGQLRVFNDTTAFGSSPRAGIVFSTKYRTSPDIPLDGAAIYGGKENSSDADKDFFLAFATRDESPNEAVERMRITSSGSVGIGTTSPSFKLSVAGGGISTQTSANDGALVFLPLGGSNENRIYSRSSVSGTGNKDLAFRIGDTERARIDSSGRLLVGTSSSPSASNGSTSLSVIQGNTSSATGAGYLSLQRGQAAASISSGAGLGLINFGDSAGQSYAYIQAASDAAGGTDDYPGRLIFATTSDGGNFPTERMRIDSSGNVGIGTNSPNAELSVHSTSQNAAVEITRGTVGSEYGYRIFGTNGATNSALTFFDVSNGSLGSERMRLDSSGNLLVGVTSAVGISGTPADSNSTEIGRGYINISRDDTQAADHILFGKNGSVASSIGTSTTNSLIFKTGTTERMRVASDGVVTVKNGAVAEIDTLTSASTVTPDFAASCNFTLTLGTNVTLANPSNLTAGQSGSIFLVQDSTGSRTITFGSYWDFAGGTAPTLSTAASSVDRLDYIVRSSTSIHAVVTLAYS